MFQYSISFTQDFKEYYPDPLTPGGHVAWADYDKDGDPDLVTSGVINDKSVGATILYRNDNGQFVETSDSFNGLTGFPKWIDWENDGDLDLFLIGTESRIFKNVNGSFTMHYFLNTSFFVWADYELDGDEDMFFIVGNYIGVMKNVGGTFQWTQLIDRLTNVKYFTVADFNLDGSLDFLVKIEPYDNTAVAEYRLYIYNPKNGYYEVDKSNSFVFTQIYQPQSFDVDDDGDADILYAGKLNDTDTRSTYLYINTAGKFSLSPDPFFETGYASIRDLDGDGDSDVIKNENNGTVYYRNDEGGKYSKITNNILNQFGSVLSTSYSGATPDGFNYACISGQVTFNGTWSTRIYRLENGSYTNIYPNPFDQLSTSYYEHTQWVDYNKDGLIDAFVSGKDRYGNGPKAKLYQNTGIGFSVVHTFDDNTTSRGDWVDFNRDDNIDFITNANRDITIYEGFQSDPPSVTRKTILSGAEQYVKPQVIDFDRDNDNDIFVGGYMGGMYTNSNNILTKTIAFINGYRTLGEADWADYDLDGDKDMVMFVDAGWTTLQKVCIYRNGGSTLSLLPGTPFTSLEWAHCKWIDYNQDGYPDLFVFGERLKSKYVYLYKNVGGVFTAQPTASFTDLNDIEIYGMQISIVDFDLNGFPDIVINGNGKDAPKLQVYRNINGTFQNYSSHGLPTLWDSRVNFNDFDGDGDPDVLYAGSKASGPKTQIYINQIVNLNRGPSVISTIPANNQKLTYNSGFTLTVQFSEPVLKGNGFLKFYRKSDNKLLYEIAINDAAVTVNGTSATIKINVDPFDDKDQIYVLLDAKAFIDTELNPGKGIVSPLSWNLIIQNYKLDQTISFPSLQSVSVGDPDFVLNANVSSGLDVSYASSNISVAMVNGNRVTIKGVGTTAITATQTGNTFYNSAHPVTQMLTVNKAKQTISFYPPSNKRMGDPPFSLVASASSSLNVSFSSISNRIYLNGDKVTLLQAGPVTIKAEQQGDLNFEAAIPVIKTFCINPSQPKIAVTSSAGISTLTSSSETGNQWYKDGEPINGETSRILEVTSNGSYTLVVTIEGCSSEQSSAENVLITSLNNEGSKELLLFPNPTSHKLTVNTSSFSRGKETEIQILDVYGKSVLHFRSTQSSFELDVNSLSNGIYSLKASSNDKSLILRFVKH